MVLTCSRGAEGSIFILLIPITSTTSFLHVLSFHPSSTSTSVRRVCGEVDVLLGVQPHDERGNVHKLFAHSNVTLSDQYPCMVNGLGEPEFEDLSLETTFQEIFDPQTKHVIEFHARLIQHPNPHQPSQQGVTLEQPPSVLLRKRQQISSSLADFGEGEFNTPDFSFVAETVLSDQFQFLIKSTFLERTTWCDVGLRADVQHHGEVSNCGLS